MRAPLSWLAEYVDLPPGITGRELAAALIGVGLEVETVDVIGDGTSGPLVIGRVEAIEELTEFRKPIRFCQVDVGAANGGVRGIVCGAQNFRVGDLVVVALPGTVLPGGFRIAARETYGHTSDGMICSAAELQLAGDHSGILVLPPDTAEVGAAAGPVLGLGDEVLDIAVTPDRGYCLSVRGIAREAATALAVDFADPALRSAGPYPDPDAPAPSVVVTDTEACSQFTAVRLSEVDPNAASPWWLQRRLLAGGMRSVSLAVDVTNYVMLELGQPLHAFDAGRITGPIQVRRAVPGEQLETLDHVRRELDPDDLLIADDSGPIGLAGTMGGLSTEISEGTTEVVLEAAHFAPDVVARSARRYKLPSEASRRFERGVDPALPWVASQRAAELLVGLGGGRIGGGTGVGEATPATVILFDPTLPERVAGTAIDGDQVTAALTAVGAEIVDGPTVGTWAVRPPSWRPDLRDPADLVEEVLRLHGYENLPATLPSPPAGRGLTAPQRLRRAASRALAGAGLVEVLNYPFVGQQDYDQLGLDAEDPRRTSVTLANPLSDEQGQLRTTLLPGLLAAARRNLSRGADGVGIYETGLVFRPGARHVPARVGVDGRPGEEELADLAKALPVQPLHAAAVLAGVREPAGWWGPAREAGWADAVECARALAAGLRADVTVEAVEKEIAPWHPGRCAALRLDGHTIGYAGELHPRVVTALGLPARTAAMEVDLGAVIDAAQELPAAPALSTYPVAKEDVALVVAEDVPAQDVARALRTGGGELLESVRLFDTYVGSQIPEGAKSLAFSLRFRARDRTLADAEVTAARDAAVAEATSAHGAVLRSA